MKGKVTKHFTLLILLILLIKIEGGSAPATWTGTSLIQAGSKTIVQNSVHQRSDHVYTYTYSPSFSVTPFTALGVTAFETTDLHEFLIKFMINIPNYTSTTSLQIRMNNPTDTDWRTFKVSYIAIDNSFSALRVDYLVLSNPSNVGAGVGTRSTTGIFNLNIGAVNVLNKISIMPLLVGLTSKAINGEHTVLWTTELNNATSITYSLTV